MGNKFRNILLVGLGIVVGVVASIQFSAMAQKQTAPLPLDELRQLADVFGLIKSDYVEPVEDKKLLTEAISGMVSSLDPHSAYLDKKAFQELKEGTQGRFGGLGIEVGMEDGYVKVISPIEDTPAYRAGIKPGDLITKLDNTSVKGLTLDEAVKKMRGDPSTKITLTIARKNMTKPIVITLVREEIQVKSVKSKVIEPGYAWLRIAQFQEPTVEDLATHINRIYARNPNIKGIVLDLRNDPGGILPGAIGVSQTVACIIGIALALLVACLVGGLHTLAQHKFNMPSFIITLATLNLMYGLAGIVCEGFPIANAYPAWFMFLGTGKIGVVPVPAIILILVAAFSFFMMRYTTTGRAIYAVGGNAESARLSGINVGKTKFVTFAVIQLMCVLAAFMNSAQLASGSYSFGRGWEVDVVSATVIGGTSMDGGIGNPWGTLMGILFLGVINNGMTIMNVDIYMQYVIRALIMIFAVLISTIRAKAKA